MTQPHADSTANTLPAFKAVLWDMDGTLVLTEPLHLKSIQIIGDEIGMPVSDEIGAKSIGVGYRYCYDMLQNELGEMPVSFEIWQDKVAAAYLTLTASVAPRPQAIDAVKYFHEMGLPQFIVTNSPRIVAESNARGFLRFFENPDDIFIGIISADEMKRPKPEPDGYLQAAEFLGIKPQECLVFEDSPTGVKSGVASGCFTVYWYEHKPVDLPVTPGMTVNDIGFLFKK